MKFNPDERYRARHFRIYPPTIQTNAAIIILVGFFDQGLDILGLASPRHAMHD